MRRHQRPRRAAQRGFSLAEIIAVIVVLGIGSLAVIAIQGGLFTQVKETQDAQTVTFQLQSCAEKIIAVRKELGVEAASNVSCSEFNATVSAANWVPGALDNIAFPPCTLAAPSSLFQALLPE